MFYSPHSKDLENEIIKAENSLINKFLLGAALKGKVLGIQRINIRE